MKKLSVIFLLLFSSQAFAANNSLMNANLQNLIKQFIENNDQGELTLKLSFDKNKQPINHFGYQAPYWSYETQQQFNYQQSYRFRRCC